MLIAIAIVIAIVIVIVIVIVIGNLSVSCLYVHVSVDRVNGLVPLFVALDYVFRVVLLVLVDPGSSLGLISLTRNHCR